MDIAVSKQGDTFVVYDYKTGEMSRDLSRSEVNRLLAENRKRQSQTETKAAESAERLTEAPATKITPEMTEQERYEALKDRKLENIPVTTEISESITKKIPEITSWEDLNKYFGQDKRNLIRKLATEFGTIGKEYFNKDIQLSFGFSGNNFEESYSKQRRNFSAFAKMLSVFDAVIENAVGVEVHNRTDYKPDPTLDNVFVLMSAYQEGDSIIPVKLEIKKFKDKQNTLYVAISLNKIKKTELYARGNTENGVTQRTRSVNISISKIFEKINPSDKSFLKYIPDGFLNDVQKTAKREAIAEDRRNSAPETRSTPKLSERQREVAELDKYARENIEDYDSLNEPSKRAIRALLRQGRANGVSEDFLLSCGRISARSGLNVVFSKELCFVAADGSYADGATDLARGRIVINPEPKSRTLESVLIHELTHAIYNGKNGVLTVAEGVESMTETEKDNIRNRYKKVAKGDTTVYTDEINAHYAETTLKNKNILERLVAKNPTVKEKILAFFKNAGTESDEKLTGAAKKLYKQYKKLFDGYAARNFQENASEFMSKLVKNEADDASDRSATGINDEKMQDTGDNDKDNETLEGDDGTRLALTESATPKITAEMSDAERAEILSKKQVVAPIYTGQADAAILANKDKLESGKVGIVAGVIQKLGEDFGVVGEEINIEDVEVVITLSKSNLRKSVTAEATPEQLAKLIPVLKDTARSAIGIERHDNRYFFDSDTVYFDNLLGGYIDGNDFVPIRFGLKHSRTGNVVLYVVVDQNKIPRSFLTEIKKTEVVKTPAANADPEVSRSVTYSIAQIIEFVNSGDLLRYIPDEMLTEAQKTTKYEAIAKTIERTNTKNDERYAEYISNGDLDAAKQMVFNAAKAAGYTIHAYHGSNADFNVFEQSKEGALGEGVYFAESKEYAQGVAPNGMLYDVFLRITNPYEAKYPSGISQESLIAQGYDGVHHEGNGFWVAFEPSQAKSAETITYDDSGKVIPLSKRFNPENKDIRYALDNDKTLEYTDSETQKGDAKNEISKNPEVLAERGLSSSHRGRDGLWKQGYDPEDVYQRLANSQNGESRGGKTRSGHSGWLREGQGSTLSVLRLRKGVFRDLRGRQLSGKDTAGRLLSPNVKRMFAESVFKNENGDLLSLYHWTGAKFKDFEKGDIGFHLGTLHASYKRYQQDGRAKQPSLSFYKECYVNLKNPVIIDYDPIRWDVFPTAHKLNQQGVLSNEDIGKLEKMDGYMHTVYDSPAAVELRRMIAEKGFDGIIYTNHSEGDISVIVLYPDQIYTVAENGIDLEYRTDASEGGKRFALSSTREQIVMDTTESAYKPKVKDKAFSGFTAFQIDFVNEQAGIETVAKKLGIKKNDIEVLVQTARSAQSQATEMIVGNQYRIGKDKKMLGDGLAKIFKPIRTLGKRVPSLNKKVYDKNPKRTFLFHKNMLY